MTSGPTPARPAALAFVLVMVLLDVIALGIIIPVFPKLVEGMAGGDTARAAVVLGLFSTAWALMQLLFSPLMGALSDRFGRRPVLLISTFGLGLDYILMALAPSLAWLFLGRVISGICAATFSTATAYIADVTPPEERAQRFGMIGAAFGAGFVLGPAIGGLLGGTDPRLPFWVAGVFCLLNGLYGLIVLPESLPPERRAPFRPRTANPIGALKFLSKAPLLAGLSGVLFLFHLSHAVLPALFVLYTGYRYQWDERWVGLSLALFGVLAAVVQAGLVRIAIARLGERVTLAAGLTAGAIGMAIAGLATTSAAFLASIAVISLWGLVSPAVQSLMSRHVSPSEQGRLQGAGSSLMAFANIIAPTVFSQIFAASIAAERAQKWPGLALLLAAGLLCAALALALRVTRGMDRISSAPTSS